LARYPARKKVAVAVATALPEGSAVMVARVNSMARPGLTISASQRIRSPVPGRRNCRSRLVVATGLTPPNCAKQAKTMTVSAIAASA